MITLPPFKRGDTWSLVCTYKRSGEPVDISNIDIYSQIRDSKMGLVADLVVTKTSDTGNFILAPKNPDTNQWSLGNLLCDIEFVNNGVNISTETFTLPVVEQITRIGVQ